MKVLLVCMPFATTTFPAVGISMLKPKLNAEGIHCDIKYFSIDFAKVIGLGFYEKLCINHTEKTLIGEWLFAKVFFGSKLPPEHAYFNAARPTLQDLKIRIGQLIDLKKRIPPFIEQCIHSIDLVHYDVIGFTTVFEQNMASVALAHHIKRLYPRKIIVFGGANCDGEMGRELHRQFPLIDYVSVSEAEESFCEFIKRLSNQQPFDDIPGIIFRKNGESILTRKIVPVQDLEALPYPDYDDYFEQYEMAFSIRPTEGGLPMETSRGCWWGEKSQCAFCGLNPQSIGFRSKSKNRVMTELLHLVRKYDLHHIQMVDNILDMKYFDDLLPELKRRQLPTELFYEVKANLKKEQLQLLRDAGITWIQPGIESLNSHVLRLMRKGVTALQNIQLIKNCEQLNIDLTWNIIYGFPDETEEDYRQMVDTIYRITHLIPPEACAHFTLQRFSPYFNNAAQYGIVNVRPEKIYRFIYPFDDEALTNLSFYFEFDYNEGTKQPNIDKPLSKAFNYWKDRYAGNEHLVSYETSPSTLLLQDSRSVASNSQILLESDQKDIYQYCDQIRSFSAIFSYIRKVYGMYPVRERDVRDFLEEMIELNLMISEKDRYLGLAIPYEEKIRSVRHPITA